MAKFKTSKENGRTVHTYGTGKKARRVVLPAAKPVDPYAAPVDAAVKQKFEPVQQQLATATTAQTQRQQQIDDWYSKYKQDIAAAGTQNAAAARQQQAALAGVGTAMSANDRAGTQAIQSQMSADAAARGATVDPAVASQLQQGSSVRGANLGTSQALAIFQANQQGVSDRSRLLGSEGSRIAALGENAAKIGALEKQKTDLSKEIGAFKVSHRADLEDAAQKAALENAAFGIKETLAASTVANTNASIRDKSQRRIIARKAQSVDAADRKTKLGIEQQKANTAARKAATAGAKAGKSSLLTPVQQSKYTAVVPKLTAALKAGKTPDQLADSGPFSPEINRTLVRAAMDVRAYGAVTPATVQRLHKIGIRVNGNFKTISRKDAVAKRQQDAITRRAGAAIKGVF